MLSAWDWNFIKIAANSFFLQCCNNWFATFFTYIFITILILLRSIAKYGNIRFPPFFFFNSNESNKLTPFSNTIIDIWRTVVQPSYPLRVLELLINIKKILQKTSIFIETAIPQFNCALFIFWAISINKSQRKGAKIQFVC